MSAKLFLAYAKADHAFAEKVARGLRQDGIEISSDRDITKGDDWGEQLQVSLKESDGVVVILSDASLDSSFVMMELGAAKALDKRVVAIRRQKADLPPALASLELKTLDVTKMSVGELSHTIQTELAS
jgi:hypothetical protein